jgi:RNA polymerase sigma-70 factor (ECF subfamily)
VAEATSTGAGDFEAVHREFRPRIRRYLRHLAGEAEADDLTQTVFLKVSSALPAFRGEASLSTWIYHIATNVARDHARASGRWSNAEIESVEDLPDPAREAADRAYIRQEMRACIRELVEKLPEQYRAPLLLSDFEELANAQIAEILGLSLDTVKIRLYRARVRLRAEMECGCTFYRDDGNELMCDRKEK